MARFDVFAGPKAAFSMDVRSDQLERLGNYLMVPLLPAGSVPTPIPGLNPILHVGGVPYVMATQFIAAVPRHRFGRPIDNLMGSWDEITRALDILLFGF